MTSRSLLPTLGAGLVVASSLGAQTHPELIRADWELHRETVLAYVDAMPEEHFSFRPTPEVRTFAEQIEHIVVDHVNIVQTSFRPGEAAPDLGDREDYLRDQEALKEHVNAGYDYVLQVLEETSEAELREEAEVFGRYRVPRWRALERALEHGTWTLGQVIPYLRVNGVEPPPYQVFHPSTLIDGGTDMNANPPGEKP